MYMKWPGEWAQIVYLAFLFLGLSDWKAAFHRHGVFEFWATIVDPPCFLHMYKLMSAFNSFFCVDFWEIRGAQKMRVKMLRSFWNVLLFGQLQWKGVSSISISSPDIWSRQRDNWKSVRDWDSIKFLGWQCERNFPHSLSFLMTN